MKLRVIVTPKPGVLDPQGRAIAHALGSLAGQELFWEVDERYWHRHALKPGITGLAQVRGYRGATLRRDDLTRRLQADLEYIAGWSVWRDFAILLSTVRVVVHKNAY